MLYFLFLSYSNPVQTNNLIKNIQIINNSYLLTTIFYNKFIMSYLENSSENSLENSLENSSENKIKKKLNPYQLFIKENYPIMKKNNPLLNSKEIFSKLASEWSKNKIINYHQCNQNLEYQ